jgi:hypothetical protein
MKPRYGSLAVRGPLLSSGSIGEAPDAEELVIHLDDLFTGLPAET